MASYAWLKATLFQAKEEKDRTDVEKEFINQHLTKDKYKNRTPQQAKRDFLILVNGLGIQKIVYN